MPATIPRLRRRTDMKSVAVALLAGQGMRHFASSKNHPFAKVVVRINNVVAYPCTNGGKLKNTHQGLNSIIAQGANIEKSD